MADQEREYDIELDGLGLMLQAGGYSVASVNNPAGLRSTGGNALREYSQWTESEWADFSKGAGQISPDNAGFLHSSGDTVHGGFRLEPDITSVVLENGIATGTPDGAPWGAYFAEYGGYLFVGVGNKLRIVRRNPATGAPEVMTIVRFTVSNVNWKNSWFDTDVTSPDFPFEADGDIKPNYRITGLATFGEYLAMVVTDGNSSMQRDRADATPKAVVPGAVEPANYSRPTGMFLVRAEDAVGQLEYALSSAGGGQLPNTVMADVGCTGYYAYVATPDPTNANVNTTIARLDDSSYEAIGCGVWNGLLWFWAGNVVFYTNGTILDSLREQLYPNPDEYWRKYSDEEVRYWGWFAVVIPSCSHFLEAPLWKRFDTYVSERETITGMVSLQGNTIGENVVYVSTNRSLYLIMPGDVVSYVTTWSTTNWWNGMGCTEHNGDAYFPVGDGLVRVTPTGQILFVGLDQMPAKPVRSHMRHGAGLASVYNTLISMSDGTRPAYTGTHIDHWIATRVWGMRNQGWHPVASLHGDKANGKVADAWRLRAQGCYFDTSTRSLWWVLGWPEPYDKINNNPSHTVGLYVQSCVQDINPGEDAFDPVPYRHELDGWFVLPPFDAGAISLKKDWNQVSVYGSCFAGSIVECWFKYSDGLSAEKGCDTQIHYADTGWTMLGRHDFTTEPATDIMEFDFPLTAQEGRESSRALLLKFYVKRGPDPALSPWLQIVRLEHHDYIQDYFRFSLGLGLPWDCLTDVCGDMVKGYDQKVYDAHIKRAICATLPVKFMDVDGEEYYVRVESASRRISNIGRRPDDGTRSYDVSWSLVLTQTHPESVCQ